MEKPVRIIVDPRFIISYSSYYLLGFKRFDSSVKIAFSLLDLEVNSVEDYRRGCAMRLEYDGGRTKKLFIDTNDGDSIHPLYHRWADLYAKVNLKISDLGVEKALSIGPSFAVKLWNPAETIARAVRNYLRARKGFSIPFATYFRDWCYTFIRRRRYEDYIRKPEEDSDYVFAMSTLWYDEKTFSTTNRYRGVFARACRRFFPRFEGGFFYIDSPEVINSFPRYSDYLNEYSDMLTTDRIPMKEYLDKTSRSAIVFNTPSVSGCHGWKLAEYLAMGKAVISMPLNNAMPGDFCSSCAVLTVNSEEEITTAVEYLHDNPAERDSLKTLARRYFIDYLAPEAVITHILEHLA